MEELYLTCRALVRAKVAGIRFGQRDLSPAEAQQVREAFGSYLDLAERYTQPARPRLLITHGLSGSGKTYSTQRLVEATGAVRLRSDVERKRLFGLAPLERSTDHRDLDLYALDATRRPYDHLAQQAARVIEAGWTALVDATFLKRTQREAFRRLAAQLGVPCTILAFCAHPETLRRRVAQRNAQGADASEADLAILHGQLTALEPLTTEEQVYALTIDTDPPQAPQHLLEAIQAMGEKL